MNLIRTNAPDGAYKSFVTDASPEAIRKDHNVALKAWMVKNGRLGDFTYTWHPVEFVPCQRLARLTKDRNSKLSLASK